MAFNGFGTQTAWPDGTGFAGEDGEISKGRTSIRDLSQGVNSFVSMKWSQVNNIDHGKKNQLFKNLIFSFSHSFSAEVTIQFISG